MKRIFVINTGRRMKVDDKNYMWMASFNWRDDDGLIRTKINGKLVSAGKLVLGDINSPLEADHEDRDPYNNQLSNLRWASRTENAQNRKGWGNYSKHKGVTWCKRTHRWQAVIQVNGVKIYLGSFLLEEEAARAYNEAALKYFGKFAVLNKV